MNHKEKVRLAKRILTKQERSDKTPKFLSAAWLLKKKNNQLREIARKK